MCSASPEPVDCFSVFATAEPSALPRVLDVFGLFGVIPERCHSARVDSDPDQLVIDLQVAGLPTGRPAQLIRRLDRVIVVTQVLHSQKLRAETGCSAPGPARAA